jgi:hypothetical protein
MCHGRTDLSRLGAWASALHEAQVFLERPHKLLAILARLRLSQCELDPAVELLKIAEPHSR